MADSPREIVRMGQDAALDKAEHDNLGRVANTLASSGLFPDATSGAQAFAKILLGRSIGLGPMEAMTGIHIVEGKPQLAATTLAGFVREHPDYDYEVVDHNELHCELLFYRHNLTSGMPEKCDISDFTFEEAKVAGLVKDKSAWKKYPKNMLFARAMSNGVRWYCPDLFGGVPVYTEADEFEVRPQLTAGSGTGEPSGIELPADVKDVLARAGSLGHAGLADRGAAEMALAGRDPADVSDWCHAAELELNAYADTHPVEAEVVPEHPADLLARGETDEERIRAAQEPS